MDAQPASGTDGYAAEADALFVQYESIAFADLHRPILPLLPAAPARVLDVGAGTGRDAAALAAMGHSVTAAEPTAELRTRAAALHPSSRIDWLDDALPDLPVLVARRERFDAILLTAVWMHLDEPQRRRAMPNVACLLRPGGLLALTLRHGPVPPGRRIFEVPSNETACLAEKHGLLPLLRLESQDGQLRRPGVTWTRLAFRKSADGI